jgi:hypothetical protein
MRLFNGKGSANGTWVEQTADRGYIVAGSTSAPGRGPGRPYLTKTDSLGNREWSGIYGEDGEFNAVQQTRDSGYIACGCSGKQLLLVRVGPGGETLWSRLSGNDGKHRGWSVQQTADGGFIVGGDAGRILLMRTDSLGNLLWERRYGDAWYEEDPYTPVRQTADGGYIVGGATDDYNAMLLKADPSGDTVWVKRYPFTVLTSERASTVFGVEQTPDLGYIVTGIGAVLPSERADCRMYILKTDSMGNREWERLLGTRGENGGYSVFPTADGGVIAAGVTQPAGTDKEVGCLVRTDANGRIRWARTIGADHAYGLTRCARQTRDGGYIATGFLAGPVNSLYLLKLAPDSKR